MGICPVDGDSPEERHNELMDQPVAPTCKIAVVQFKVKKEGVKNGGTDKGPDGNRIDSIPIANGCIKNGAHTDMVLYDADDHDGFVSKYIGKYDAFIVRINPGQLSQGTPEGTQAKFDAMMTEQIAQGKKVWSSPAVQTQMGAKDALVKIKDLKCGLTDTLAYYTEDELREGFCETMAFQPRVIKQNRGSAGEGIWLCWLCDGETNNEVAEYPSKTFREKKLEGTERLKLMEMNDNHVEYKTVNEFLAFCIDGPGGEVAGEWDSKFPGEYLKGGQEAGGQLVDQRLLPRISEGEVRCMTVGDECQSIIHKQPDGEGNLSAVGGLAEYTYYKPEDPKYADLLSKLKADIPQLLEVMGLVGNPLPLLWTADYIPKDPEDRATATVDTEYVVGEFNCSCVGVSKFQAVCGGEKTLADIPDEDYFEACQLTDLMGKKAVEMIMADKSNATQ